MKIVLDVKLKGNVSYEGEGEFESPKKKYSTWSS